MAVDDLWVSSKRGPDGERARTSRYGRGMRWRVRFTDDQGKKVEKLFERRADAERFDSSARAAVAQGTYVDIRAGQETVRSYGEKWLTRQLYRPGTTDRVDRTLRLHVFPTIGRRAIASVRPGDVQGWVTALDLAPGTVRTLFSTLASLFAAAVRDRVIGVSPCVGVRLPALPPGQRELLTPAQVLRAADVVPARYRAAILLGAGCGLRVSEVLGLERGHLPALLAPQADAVVHVRQQLGALPREAPHLADVKSAGSRRTVELPAIVADALAAHVERFAPVPQTISDRIEPRKTHDRPAELLFTNEAGRPVTRSAFGHVWRTAREDAELPTDATFHDLRHYYASLLIAGGASVKTVQNALGHSSPTITLDTYVHLWPDVMDRPRALVDAAFSVAASSTAPGAADVPGTAA